MMRATAFNQQVAQSLAFPSRKCLRSVGLFRRWYPRQQGLLSDRKWRIGRAIYHRHQSVPSGYFRWLGFSGRRNRRWNHHRVLENLAEFFDSQYLQVGNLYNIAPFYVLLIILAFKPYGLFGTKDIERI